MTTEEGEYVSVESAGNLAGISPRTLRYWIAAGKLPAVAGKRGKLVNLDDVRALAELTGKSPATTWQVAGNVGNPARSAGNVAEDADETSAIVVPDAVAQLEATREALFQLIADVRAVERDNGRLTAERDASREREAATTARLVATELRVEQAEAQLAEARAEIELLREIAATRQDAPVASPAPPGREMPPDLTDTIHGEPSDERSHVARWLSRILGRG